MINEKRGSLVSHSKKPYGLDWCWVILTQPFASTVLRLNHQGVRFHTCNFYNCPVFVEKKLFMIVTMYTAGGHSFSNFSLRPTKPPTTVSSKSIELISELPFPRLDSIVVLLLLYLGN